MILKRLIRTLGVLLIGLSLYWIWLDLQDWFGGEVGLWSTAQRVFIRLGSGFAGGVLCLFFPDVKLEMFKYGKSPNPEKRSRFARRLEGKSKYDYDEDDVIELDSDNRSGM